MNIMYFTFLLMLLSCIIVITARKFVFAHQLQMLDPGNNITLNPNKLSFFGTKSPSRFIPSIVEVPADEIVRLKKRSTKPSVEPCVNLTSCVGRCMTKREFHKLPENRHKPACYCDPECNWVFSDCCADYEQQCKDRGFRKRPSASSRNNRWQCFDIKGVPFGVWMIGRCKPNWPTDDVSQKCTNFSERSRTASLVIPVFDKKKTTYRNRYCAECNDITKFTQWKFKIKSLKCAVKAPKNYSKFEKMKHQDNYCNAEKIKFKYESRGVRHCYEVQNKCKYMQNKDAVLGCSRGTTGLVSLNYRAFRNLDCLLCNQNPRKRTSLNISCAPRVWDFSIHGRSALSLAAIFEVPSEFLKPPKLVPSSRCSADQVYDGAAGYCRKLIVYDELISSTFLKKFAIRLEYNQTDNESCLKAGHTSSKQESNTTANIQQQFHVLFKGRLDASLNETDLHLSDFSIHFREMSSCLVTFQILGTREEASNFSLSYSKIKQVDIQGISSVCRYSLSQIITREVACTENNTYVISADDLKSANGSIFVNATQGNYKSGEYVVYKYENETRIAVCKDSKPINCTYYLDVKNRTRWELFPNRSIYSQLTASWFHYGEYSIMDGTLWLCLTEDFLVNTYKIQSSPTSVHNAILSYTTLVSLTISITSLVVLLIIYSLFSSLRNLPGKNLMLLSGTLAIAQLLWLMQKEIISRSSTLCVATTVALQYFFLSSFCCSGSSALHSFLTFRSLANGKLSHRTKSNAFLWYAMYGLGIPLCLVTASWLLDYYGIIFIGYGTAHGHCWFGSKRGLYIAFIYPLFILLLFNLFLLLSTLRVIYKCTKASQELAEKNGGTSKKHVGIYLRMSTIMGFTWLFGLLQLLFPGSLVFQYVFVFVNGFQGFYLAAAFLSTTNVRKIISGKTVKERNSSFASTRRTTTTAA